MSLEAYVWAASLTLARCNGTAFRVLLLLADKADALGYGAYPSVTTMSESLDCSDRTVQRALAQLRKDGLVRRGDQRPVAHIRADLRPTVYDVMTPALVAHEHRNGVTRVVTPLRRVERGDNRVTPLPERGDNYGLNGVTTGVARTVP